MANLNWAKHIPKAVYWGAGGVALGGAVGLGISAANIKNPEDKDLGAEGNAANTAAMVFTMAAVGGAAFLARKPIGALFTKTFGAAFKPAAKEAALNAAVKKMAAPDLSIGRRHPVSAEAADRFIRRAESTAKTTPWTIMNSVAGRGAMMMGAGALAGAALEPDDRGQGAMIGAGLGLAAGIGLRGRKIWKGSTDMQKRAYKAGAAGAVALGVGASIINTQSNEIESSANAVPEIGGYGYSDRLSSLNATGGLVMGMHGGRHG